MKIESLLKDIRVAPLIGQNITTGGAETQFTVERLLEWFLGNLKNYGEEVANDDLECFLNSQTLDLECILCLSGIRIRNEIDLFDNFKLVRTIDLPINRDVFEMPYRCKE